MSRRRRRDLKSWASSSAGRTVLRFAMCSVVVTAFSSALVALLYGARWLPNELAATLVANLIGILPAYNLNRRWAWGMRGRSSWRNEVAPFVGMSLLGASFSLLGAHFVRDVVQHHTWPHLFNTALVTGTNVLSFAIFWVLKILVFNRIFRRPVLA